MKINKSIKRLVWVFVIVIILCLGGYFLLTNISKEMLGGERNTGLDKIITEELFDSVKVGLDKYKLIHNHYPKCSGKYFFDSIKTLIGIPDAYVYADSLSKDGKFISIKKLAGKQFDYTNISHTYLGVGIKELTIIYRYKDNDSFELYSVGENYLDENGEGDDLQY